MYILNCNGLPLAGFRITNKGKGICTQLAAPPPGGTYCQQDIEAWVAAGVKTFREAVERGVQHKCLRNAELARIEWESMSWKEQELIPHPRMYPTETLEQMPNASS